MMLVSATREIRPRASGEFASAEGPALSTTSAVIDDHAASRESSERRHAVSRRLLLILGAALLVLANLGVWLDRTVLDSEGFVDAVHATLSKDNVRDRMARQITSQVLATEAIQGFVLDPALQPPPGTDAPPPRAQPLIDAAVREALAVEVAGEARDAVLLRLHERLLTILEDRGELTDVQGDSLVIDPALQVVRLLETAGLQPPPDFSEAARALLEQADTVVLIDNVDPLSKASWLLRNRDTVVIAVGAGAALAFAASLLLRDDRVRGAAVVAGTISLVGLISLLAGVLALHELRALWPDGLIVHELVAALLESLRAQSIVITLVGVAGLVLYAIAARLASKSRTTVTRRA